MRRSMLDEEVVNFILHKYYNEKLPVRKIADELKSKGILISKSTVHNVIARERKRQEVNLFSVIELLKKHITGEEALREIISALADLISSVYREKLNRSFSYSTSTLSSDEERNIYLIKLDLEQFLETLYEKGIDRSEHIRTIGVDYERGGLWVVTSKKEGSYADDRNVQEST